ncbi:MAG: DUF1566 domain-containing protein [Halothiobacillaceae bacterium]|nr:DUF1566 domain-containing protein [Halothiobacillaceae bacterium]
MRMAKATLSFMAAALLATSSTLALAQTCNSNMPLSKPDSRYTYNAAGDEVTDSVTSLTWKRCAEGMNWSGDTCTGTPNEYTWEAAVSHAATQTGWRLPSIKELKSLIELACYGMGINQTAFPETPHLVWSASTVAAGTELVWFVNFGLGDDDYGKKGTSASVRLVRSR